MAAAVIRKNGAVLIARRPPKGLLGGMWEFPNAAVRPDLPGARPLADGFSVALLQRYGLKVRQRAPLGTIKHAYSHFRVTVQALNCELASMARGKNLRWVSLASLSTFPMGRIDRQIAERLRA